eukprot:gene26712-biopygen17209
MKPLIAFDSSRPSDS